MSSSRRGFVVRARSPWGPTFHGFFSFIFFLVGDRSTITEAHQRRMKENNLESAPLCPPHLSFARAGGWVFTRRPKGKVRAQCLRDSGFLGPPFLSPKVSDRPIARNGDPRTLLSDVGQFLGSQDSSESQLIGYQDFQVLLCGGFAGMSQRRGNPVQLIDCQENAPGSSGPTIQ